MSTFSCDDYSAHGSVELGGIRRCSRETSRTSRTAFSESVCISRMVNCVGRLIVESSVDVYVFFFFFFLFLRMCICSKSYISHNSFSCCQPPSLSCSAVCFPLITKALRKVRLASSLAMNTLLTDYIDLSRLSATSLALGEVQSAAFQ